MDPFEGPFESWKTPIQNVGTDHAEWRVLARQVRTGSLEGATIPLGVVPPLLSEDTALSVLKTLPGLSVGQNLGSFKSLKVSLGHP